MGPPVQFFWLVPLSASRSGVWILFEARGVYVHGVGLLLVAYASFMLLRPRIVVRRQHPLFDATAGLLGGITGGAVAFPGAFVTIWCGLKGWTKERQRALIPAVHPAHPGRRALADRPGAPCNR